MGRAGDDLRPPRSVECGGELRADAVVSGSLDELLDRIGQQPFRAKFHLRGRERALVQLRSAETIRRQARELVTARLAAAAPRNDGRQTPYRGHPVFVAQHATGTCCRTCLSRNHGIDAGRPLAASELDYVVDVIWRWIEREPRTSTQTVR